jgi:hypothetical protein
MYTILLVILILLLGALPTWPYSAVGDIIQVAAWRSRCDRGRSAADAMSSIWWSAMPPVRLASSRAANGDYALALDEVGYQN